ncbi:hypothetical protein VTN96DRAFT_1654 [Rasamsonia emersonii]|uniref:Anaphase-promoting complex subunit 2 n=1 Tax=Rasamsonia emersonii (strain ATCC 16479 / CBS 393.64 / IMI 116815) TaxID=1408163 RepID=A0A0F4Z554_RASE3|nr:Anaphase-promoting complex subunit ApcB [Rasamsonia emersonii CBS 393.64]KKA25211.1 Anaphase-promoting complex subunit ApcB [Rasamsonia emersonii CBS 393.64]
MSQNAPLSMSRKRVFDSVFAPTSLKSLAPTTGATPASAFTPDQPLGTTTQPSTAANESDVKIEESSPEQIIWDRAWHAATTFLSFPDRGFEVLTTGDPDGAQSTTSRLDSSSLPSREISDSLAYLLAPSSRGRALRAGLKEHDLVEWYGNEMRRHFLTNFRAGFVQLLEGPAQDGLLSKIVGYLQSAQRIYYTPFLRFVVPHLDAADQEAAFLRLRRSFHAIVAYSLPSSRTSALLATELTNGAVVILGIESAKEERAVYSEAGDQNDGGMDDMDIDRKYSTSYRVWKDEPSEAARIQMMTEGEDAQISAARERLLRLLGRVQDVGLGGERGQKAFARVMNNMMTEFITATYTGQWEAPSLVTQHLRLWTENVFARLVVEVLNIFRPYDVEGRTEGQLDVTLGDVGKWQEIAIARLGALRTSELFDVIVEWDSSSGAIEDLRQYANNPATRFSLASSFIGMLNQRLLHPGASTVEILQLYISIIRAFNLLDPKGVLLDRIARPIRKYLRDREDTVKVIVSGLLADAPDTEGQNTASSSDTLVELSAELSKAHQQSLQVDSGELDWDDMNWMPDPIDAAADYKKSKGSDVIGSLISLFESKEAFVKELQNLLSERLLKKRADFDQEMSVLELLKVRFGDGALQACEVMLRDVLDSKRVDAVVRSDQGLIGKQPSQEAMTPDRSMAAAEQAEEMPQLHAKILSRFFWPTLQDQNFKVPDEIASLQQRYAAGFESLKQSRKLTWLNALGQVTVELDLEDRVFTDEVTTWQATVIYAFQSPGGHTGSSTSPVTKTVAELSDQLEMPASLVRSACLFWVSKRILVEVQRDTFRVLEVLPNEEERDAAGGADSDMAGNSSTEASAAAAADAAAAAERESANAAAMEKMNLYWQFIVGMLTNQGAMPLQRIVMMLKIAVPGGFPYSNEDLREFLAGMVAQGKLEIVSGGNYKLIPQR